MKTLLLWKIRQKSHYKHLLEEFMFSLQNQKYKYGWVNIIISEYQKSLK